MIREITVLNRQRAQRIRREGLQRFVRELGRLVPSAHDSVALALVSDRRMRQLNRDFRGRAASTDVLSFADAAGASGPDGERHLGDIVICVAAAVRQARAARHSLGRELERLVLHGYLHLLGYDHETDGGTMLRLERRLAQRLGCADRRTRR